MRHALEDFSPEFKQIITASRNERRALRDTRASGGLIGLINSAKYDAETKMRREQNGIEQIFPSPSPANKARVSAVFDLLPHVAEAALKQKVPARKIKYAGQINLPIFQRKFWLLDRGNLNSRGGGSWKIAGGSTWDTTGNNSRHLVYQPGESHEYWSSCAVDSLGALQQVEEVVVDGRPDRTDKHLRVNAIKEIKRETLLEYSYPESGVAREFENRVAVFIVAHSLQAELFQ